MLSLPKRKADRKKRIAENEKLGDKPVDQGPEDQEEEDEEEEEDEAPQPAAKPPQRR